MIPTKHVIVFSHGFGVRKDDLGLLTDIATAFPKAECLLFDYFDVDEEKKTLTIRPLSAQARMLNEAIDQARASHPGAVIDLICHSQGTMVPALAKPEGIRKTILLTPTFDMGLARSIQRYGQYINLNGTSELPPVDGLTRIVPAEYWAERTKMDALREHNALAKKTELIAIEASQDHLLPRIDPKDLSPSIKFISLDGDHNFTGTAREPLKAKLRELLL